MSNIKISKNILLAPYTTFKIGGAAKYFCEARNSDDIIAAITMAKKEDLPLFILGRGSNILVSDKGFDGLVIKISAKGGPALGWQNSNNKITADTGVLLTKLVAKSIEAGATGLEWAVGIPGTLGGAIRGNAGALGGSMENIVSEVKVFNITTYEVVILKNKACGFKYRDSIFKHNKNLIILSAELELKRGNKEKSKKLIKEYIKQRKEKQPLEFPSAGSIFKNPNFGTSDVPNIIRTSDVLNIGAGYLIEQCGLRGRKIGGARVSEKHANFIINIGGAKAEDVKKLIDLCKEKVKEKFGIKLEEEIEYLGEV